MALLDSTPVKILIVTCVIIGTIWIAGGEAKKSIAKKYRDFINGVHSEQA